MKIGFFIDGYEPLVGGVIVSAKALREGLEELGHELFIITLEASPKQEEKDPYIIRFKGIPIPFNPSFKGYRYIFRYKKHLPKIKSLNLDIIHIHTEVAMGKLGLYAKKELKIPAVYTMHSFYELSMHNISPFLAKYFKNFLLQKIIKLYYKFISQTDTTIIPSKKNLEYVQKKYQIKGDYHIVPTQLNLASFYPENNSKTQIENLKIRLGLKNYFVCLYVGRLSPEKEINYLIDAFAVFNQKNPQSKFLLIGDGPMIGNLRKQSQVLGISNNVIFNGFVAYQNLGLYYQLGDVFINASLYETQGLTYIEALAAALPSIVRYDIVLEKVIQNKKNGFFFQTKEELIQILDQLYRNPQECQKISLQAQKSILHYDRKHFAQKVANIYQQIVDKYK
ncbi:glycosyltransferase [Candidatus Phytoplasma meliae]|uniref:Glycosyltransferase n=1 Tax=Candidatus Phytoplasma meliae TaxID=1848402 RepID=A0ABS5CXW2_9MOLU|nr:glycosyltransferase [Candidatus Phytoplasma meliae]MBP5835817.1 glycosyltransferase [Candidatus Phytoplasma meliae]